MNETTSFKRLVLRAVLRQVSPMVIRLVAISDQVDLPQFHDIFRAILGWNSDVGYLIRVHGQEFNSFHRKTRCKALHEFKLNRREEFLYVCDTLHMSEWDVRVLDIQDGAEGEHVPFCLDGRGATPSESCGGPTGAIERQELTMETLGMSLAESKALLEGAQKFLIVKQASEGLGQRRACTDCGQRHTTKDAGPRP
jgi:Plasmid pRiA4b ORF-3-like protein